MMYIYDDYFAVMYVIYVIEVDEYLMVSCAECYQRRCLNLTIENACPDIILPLCHRDSTLQDVTYRQCQYLMTKYMTNVVIAFATIAQALEWLVSELAMWKSCHFLLVEIDVMNCKIGHVCHDASDAVHIISADSDIRKKRSWELGIELLHHMMANGESLMSIGAENIFSLILATDNVDFLVKMQDLDLTFTYGADIRNYFMEITDATGSRHLLPGPKLLSKFYPELIPIEALYRVIYYCIKYESSLTEVLQCIDISTLVAYHAAMTTSALKSGCLKSLQILVMEKGLELTEDAFLDAESSEDPIWYLRDIERQYVTIHNYAMVVWLLQKKVSPTWLRDTYLFFCNNEYLKGVELLSGYMSPEVQQSAIRLAACLRNTQILEWLLAQHRLNGDTAQAITESDATHYLCMRYLAAECDIRFSDEAIKMVQRQYFTYYNVIVDFRKELLHAMIRTSESDTTAIFRCVYECGYKILPLICDVATESFPELALDAALNKHELAQLLKPHDAILVDLAPDLPDITLGEFLLLVKFNEAASADAMIEVMTRQGEFDITRWQHYFKPTGCSRYACQAAHGYCEITNLAIEYMRKPTNCISYVWHKGWFDSDTTECLRPLVSQYDADNLN